MNIGVKTNSLKKLAAAAWEAGVAAERDRLLPFVRACGGKGMVRWETRMVALVELGLLTPEEVTRAEIEIRGSLDRMGTDIPVTPENSVEDQS